MFAQLLRDELRGIDTAARMGGEEFAVILPGTQLEGAMAVAERIRAALAERGDPARGDGRPGPDDEHRRRPVLESGTPDELIGRADAALYRAKEQGKNRVATEVAS